MKRILILLAFLIILPNSSKSCINTYYYTVDHRGILHNADDLQKSFNTNFNLALIERKLKKISKKLEQNYDYKLLSDYAVLLLKGGRPQIALKELAKKYPNEYQIAANLGTAGL